MTDLSSLVLQHMDSASISRALEDIAGQAGRVDIALVTKQACASIQNGNNAAALKESFDAIDALSLFVWEKLHTGHWKDVDEAWRKLFAALSMAKIVTLSRLNALLPSSDSIDQMELKGDIVKICDIALLMGSPLMGNACCSLAAAICLDCKDPRVEHEEDEESARESKRQRVEFSTCEGTASSVDRIREPSLERFVSEYKEKALPVILEGLMRYAILTLLPLVLIVSASLK